MSCEKKLARPPDPVRAVSRTRLKVAEGCPHVGVSSKGDDNVLHSRVIGLKPWKSKIRPNERRGERKSYTPDVKVKPVGKGPVVFRGPKSLRSKPVGCVELMLLLLKMIG